MDDPDTGSRPHLFRSGVPLRNTGDSVSIRDGLISDNEGNDGGGIFNKGTALSVVDDTIYGNRANDGGGVWNSGTGVMLTGDTIDWNSGGIIYNPFGFGGGGISSRGPAGSISLGATILASNTTQPFIAPSNCDGPVADAGYNLEFAGDGEPATSCGFSVSRHDITDLDPNLGEPAWNGGPTQTQSIGADSPAQGAIPSTSPFCNGTDQRGAPRLQPGSSACDIGAFQSIGGYWEVAADGGIFAFNAPFFGSMGGQHLDAPIVGMAIDPVTGGYWEVAADGGIFAFGGAPFDGSMGGHRLNAPVVGMAADPSSGGYLEVAADGGIFAFGGAQFHGSMGHQHLNAPVVGMAASLCGYREVAADGGLFAFPSTGFCSPFLGSMGGQHLNAPIVGIAAPTNSQGYWEVAADGGIFAFGVPFLGSMGGQPLNQPIVGTATG